MMGENFTLIFVLSHLALLHINYIVTIICLDLQLSWVWLASVIVVMNRYKEIIATIRIICSPGRGPFARERRMTRDMSRDMLYRSPERRQHPLLGQPWRHHVSRLMHCPLCSSLIKTNRPRRLLHRSGALRISDGLRDNIANIDTRECLRRTRQLYSSLFTIIW